MNKIVFLTDLHMDWDNGKENMDRLDLVLYYLKDEDFSQLFIGGDICFWNGEVKVYEYLDSKLSSLKIPFTIIPGNHDSPELMHKVWQNEDLYINGIQSRIDKNTLYVFLDTSDGNLTDRQWLELNKSLIEFKHKRVLIIMHHPPVDSFVPFIDNSKWAFGGKTRWEETMARFTNLEIDIFCGHYHIEMSRRFSNFTVHITPSLTKQTDDRFMDYKIAHKIPAYRRIWWDDKSLYTCVRYVQ